MIIAAIIVGLIIIGLIILTNFISSSGHGDMDTGVFFGILLTILCVIEIGIVSDIIGKPSPKAIDVYQNKTTLEYKVVDGVKIDSVVIFKEQ